MKTISVSKERNLKDGNKVSVLSSMKGADMPFSTVDELKPVYSGDLNAQRRFFVTFRHLVAFIAAKIGTHSPALDQRDVEGELWCCIAAKNWELIRKYAGKGSFEGYLKRCLTCKAIDLGRRYTSRNRTHAEWEEMAKHDAGTPVGETGFASSLVGHMFTGCDSRLVAANEDSWHDFLLKILQESLEELSTEDRLIIKMSFFDQASVEQIAEVLNLACKATVYTRKNRGIARLKLLCNKRLAAVQTAAA